MLNITSDSVMFIAFETGLPALNGSPATELSCISAGLEQGDHGKPGISPRIISPACTLATNKRAIGVSN